MTKYDDVYNLIQTYLKAKNLPKVNSILQEQTLNTLKKMCTKNYFAVKNCSSTDTLTGSPQQKKNKIIKLILNNATTSPQPLPTKISKKDRMQALKNKLKNLNVTSGLSKLSEKQLQQLVQYSEDDSNRCLEENDYSGCEPDETCSAKNELCRPKNFKLSNMTNKTITKDNDEYDVLTTSKHAKSIQNKIDFEENYKEEKEAEEQIDDEDEVKKSNKKRRIKTLKKLLKNMGIKHNLRDLTNYDEEELVNLFKQPRCKEENDYDNCDSDESCHIKNEVCVDERFDKLGKLERRPITKNGKIYYILSTKQHASELQEKIDSETNTTVEPEQLEKLIVDIINNSNLRVLTNRKIWETLQSTYPDTDPDYIRTFVKQYMKTNYKVSKISDKTEYNELLDSFKNEGMKSTKPDGDCFFHSIRFLVKRTYDVDLDVNMCRSLIVNMLSHLINSDDDFKQRIRIEANADQIGNENDYLAYMNSPGSWAGEPEIIAASALFNCVLIIKSARYDNEPVSIPNKIYSNSSPKYKTIDNDISQFQYVWTLYHIGYTSDHYQYNKHIFTTELELPNEFKLPNIRLGKYNMKDYTKKFLTRQFNMLLSKKQVSPTWSSSSINFSKPIQIEPQQQPPPRQPPQQQPPPRQQPQQLSLATTPVSPLYVRSIPTLSPEVEDLVAKPMVPITQSTMNILKPQAVPIFEQEPVQEEPEQEPVQEEPEQELEQEESEQDPMDVLLAIDNQVDAKKYISENFDQSERLKMFRRWQSQDKFKTVVEKKSILKNKPKRVTMQFPSTRKKAIYEPSIQRPVVPVFEEPKTVPVSPRPEPSIPERSPDYRPPMPGETMSEYNKVQVESGFKPVTSQEWSNISPNVTYNPDAYKQMMIETGRGWYDYQPGVVSQPRPTYNPGSPIGPDNFPIGGTPPSPFRQFPVQNYSAPISSEIQPSPSYAPPEQTLKPEPERVQVVEPEVKLEDVQKILSMPSNIQQTSEVVGVEEPSNNLQESLLKGTKKATKERKKKSIESEVGLDDELLKLSQQLI